MPINAPVLPALTQAWARPSRTSSMAIRMEDCFLLRKAVDGGSCISTISGACSMASRGLGSMFSAARACRILSSCPTSITDRDLC